MKIKKRLSQKITLLMALVFCLYAGEAHAYVDPGTAGFLYQLVFIVFSAVLAFFAFFKNTVVNFFKKIFGGSSSPK